MNRLDVHTLGPLQVRLDGRSLDIGARKRRALLALLVINRRRTVPTERIVTSLWGADAPPERRKDVWVYVSRLRKALGPCGEIVQRTAGGYALDLPDDALDSARFEALVDDGRRLLVNDPPAASLVLAEALAMWAGGAFEEFATDDFALAEVARLEESRIAALEARIEADLTWMEVDELIPEIEGVVAAHPLRPRPRAALMLALYRHGRQAEALRTYQRFANRLAETAGLEPPDAVRSLEEQILMDDPALRPARPDLPIRLPEPIASFVGRADELTRIASLLDTHRLVVLTGAGGVGKTTLALEAARRLALSYDDAALADLTAAEQPAHAAALVAEALRVNVGSDDPVRRILNRLGRRRVLLVVDNCEAGIAAAADTVAALLHGAAGLRILATSRVVLGIPGEQIMRLEPLGTEPGGDAELLLRDRIAALGSSAGESVPEEALRAICLGTAGLPLLVDLAAAQLRAWPVESVIDALQDPVHHLAAADRVGPEHHRDLRANIAWSERLLPPPATTLLARLSVFHASFSLAAVEAVAGFAHLTEDTAAHELRRLVDSSLVALRPGRPSRYHMLEPVRQYAALRLEEMSSEHLVTERHGRYFIDHFVSLVPSLVSARGPEPLDEARPDDENLRAALRWAIDTGEAELAQRGAVAGLAFWTRSGTEIDALPIIDAALAASTAPSKTRAELVFLAAPKAWLGRGEAAFHELLAELRSMATELDDPEVAAWWALRRADAAMASGDDPDRVVTRYRRAVDALRAVGSPRIVNALHQLSYYLFWQWNRWSEAEAAVAEWIEIARAEGWPWEEAHALATSAWLALGTRNVERLERHTAMATAAYRRLGDTRSAAQQMHGLAIGSLQRGDLDEALRRADVAVKVNREMGLLPIWLNTLLMRVCIETALGNGAGALSDLTTVVQTAQEVNESGLIPSLAAVTARVLTANDPATAAVLFGAARSPVEGSYLFLATTRLALPAYDAIAGDPASTMLAAIGKDDFEEARTRGAALAPDAVLALVESSLTAPAE